MTTKLLFIHLLLLSPVFLFSQLNIDQASLKKTLKSDANKLSAAFLTGDYKTIVKYTYPKVIEMMGGVSNMEEVLTKTTANMKSQGMSFSNITFGEPSSIVKSGNEFQATIPQHIELKLMQGRLINTSTLIAISTDKGNSWTFVDTSNKDIRILRKALPNLSLTIIIPPPLKPVRYYN